MVKGTLSVVSGVFSRTWHIFTSRFLDVFSVLFINFLILIILVLIGTVGISSFFTMSSSEHLDPSDLSGFFSSLTVPIWTYLFFIAVVLFLSLYLPTFFFKRMKEVFENSPLTGLSSLYSDVGLGIRGVIASVLCLIPEFIVLVLPFILYSILSPIFSGNGLLTFVISSIGLIIHFGSFLVLLPFFIFFVYFSISYLVNGNGILKSISNSFSLIVSNYLTLFVLGICILLIFVLFSFVSSIVNSVFLFFLPGGSSLVSAFSLLVFGIIFIFENLLIFGFSSLFIYSTFFDLEFNKHSGHQNNQ